MGDILIFITIFNCIVVSALLWTITFFGSYLYNVKTDNNRYVQYECGFFSTNKLTPEYNFNFVISAMFLILYDVEFMMFIPHLFNLNIMQMHNNLLFVLFVLFVIFTLVLDVETNTLKWQYN